MYYDQYAAVYKYYNVTNFKYHITAVNTSASVVAGIGTYVTRDTAAGGSTALSYMSELPGTQTEILGLSSSAKAIKTLSGSVVPYKFLRTPQNDD